MEDGASSIVPYAILSVLTQLGVITPEEACSLPRYHDKNLTTTTTPSWAAPSWPFNWSSSANDIIRHTVRQDCVTVIFACKSMAKIRNVPFLAPVGQPEMMHKNFMRRHLRISVVRCSGMKFFAHFQLNTPQIKPLVSL